MKTFEEIQKRLTEIKFSNDIDIVVGIARGGIVPAYLCSRYLDKPIDFIWINYRDDTNKPNGDGPRLIRPIPQDLKGKKILLVDDRNKTGTTLDFAKKELIRMNSNVVTCVINGKADYSLFDEDCFPMPWNTNHENSLDQL